MSPLRSEPSCIVSKKVKCIFEEMNIIDDPEKQETIPMEPIEISALYINLHINTKYM